MLELFVLNGQDVGQSARLHAGDSIGRNEGNRLRLRDRSISRRHAVVEERQGLTVLVDAGSTNGLHLNGERVAEVVLTDGLEFLAGEVELRVRLDRPRGREGKVGVRVDRHPRDGEDSIRARRPGGQRSR